MSIRFGAHIPWALVSTYLEQVLDLELVPELAIKGPELDNLEDQFVESIAKALSQAGVRPTVHAPFFDLNPGALDPMVRDVAFTRLGQALSFARRLGAHLMVIHPGVDKWRYPNLDKVWLANAEEFFPALIDQAIDSDCRLAIENIYEESPDNLVQLVNALASDHFGHCFDVGHWHLFGRRPMAEWLRSIGPRLFHLHFHDNHGRADEHLPVGAGTIDFSPLQAHLVSTQTFLSATLEAHTIDHLQLSLKKAQSLFL